MAKRKDAGEQRPPFSEIEREELPDCAKRRRTALLQNYAVMVKLGLKPAVPKLLGIGSATSEREGEISSATDEPALPSSECCEPSGSQLSSEAKLKVHYKHPEMPRETERHQCSYCPYSSKERSTVARHERSHTGDRPHVCQVCQRGFARSDQLNAHLNTHTSERPYECSVCGQGFASTSGLSHHRFKHLDATEHPHRCPECGKTFARKHNLTSHLVTHTGEKRHACCVCGRQFAHRSGARHHERVVHGASSGSQLMETDAPREQAGPISLPRAF